MGAGPDHSPRRWLARVAWLAVFWIAGVAVLGLVAWLLKLAMTAVGMSARYGGVDPAPILSAVVMPDSRTVLIATGVVVRPDA